MKSTPKRLSKCKITEIGLKEVMVNFGSPNTLLVTVYEDGYMDTLHITKKMGEILVGCGV